MNPFSESADKVTTTATGAGVVLTEGGLPPSKDHDRHLWVLTIVLLVVAFLAANHRIVTGVDGPVWDAAVFFAPEYTQIADHARAGRLLLWNPWASGGEPDFAEPQIGAASPAAVLLGAITGGTEAGFRWYWIFIWSLGPLGMLLLARHLGVAPWAALVVALGFAFCGFYTNHAEHTSYVYSLSWLPFITWRLDVALSCRRLRAAAEAGGLWGLSALGGYPGLTILSGGFIFMWGLGRCLAAAEGTSPAMTGHLGHRLRFAALSVLLLVVVGAVVLAPTYTAFFKEGLGYSERAGGLTRQLAITSGASAPETLLTFSSPYLGTLTFPFWNPTLWGPTDPSGVNTYIGALPFVLAPLALFLRPRSLWRWWLLGIILICCASAVGPRLPVRGWLYDYCLPTRYFRFPEMFRAYAMFSANVLALVAAGEFQTPRVSLRSFWVRFFSASLLASACAFWAYLHITSHVHNLGDQLRRANMHATGAWLGVVAISILGLVSPKSRRLVPAFLVLIGLADAALTIRLTQRFVSDHYFSRPVWNKINAQHEPGLDLTAEGLQRQARPPAWLGGTNQNTNVPLHIATLFNDFAAKNRFHLDFEHHPVLVNMSTGPQRIWFARTAAVIRPSDVAYDAFVKRTTAISLPVLVVHPPAEMTAISAGKSDRPSDATDAELVSQLPAAEKPDAQMIRYTPNELDLRVTVPNEGWLLVTDRWTSSWRAKVNGLPEPVFGGDFIFRAVRVGPGENIIQFWYPQAGYLAFMFLSWGTLATLFVIVPAFGSVRLRIKSCPTLVRWLRQQANKDANLL